jgi:Flp pilus assembly protein TadG
MNRVIDPTLLRLRERFAVRCGLARVVRRFRTDESGATAVEFSIVAIPFFALLFAILETALAFFAAQSLETGVAEASRLIRTGQAQEDGFTAQSFKDTVCSHVDFLMNCQSGLYLDVKKYSSFTSITLGVPVDSDGNLKTTGYTYNPGNGGDIVVVRAYYQWPVFVNKLGTNLKSMPNGTHLLAATAAFRNEPFPW